MRIVLAHNFCTDSYSSVTVELARELTRLGHEVLFFSHHPSFKEPHIPFEGCRVLGWPSPRPVNLRSLFFLWRQCKVFKPDAIVAHFAASWVAALVGWWLGCTLRVTVYHTAEAANLLDIRQPPWITALKRQRRKFMYRLYHRIVCVSHFAASDIQQYFGVQNSKLVVVHHGIADRYQPTPLLPHPPLRLGYIGRLDQGKQVALLLQLVQAINQEGKFSIQLEVAGDGLKAGEIADLAKNNPGIRLLGKIPYEQVDAFILRQHFTILPTLAETFGYTILESLMLGVPVLASRVGGIPELVNHGYEGFLFDPTHPNDIKLKIENAWEVLHKQHHEYVKMQNNCRLKFKGNFTMETAVSAYLHLLTIESNRNKE